MGYAKFRFPQGLTSPTFPAERVYEGANSFDGSIAFLFAGASA